MRSSRQLRGRPTSFRFVEGLLRTLFSTISVPKSGESRSSLWHSRDSRLQIARYMTDCDQNSLGEEPILLIEGEGVTLQYLQCLTGTDLVDTFMLCEE